MTHFDDKSLDTVKITKINAVTMDMYAYASIVLIVFECLAEYKLTAGHDSKLSIVLSKFILNIIATVTSLAKPFRELQT